MNNTFDVTEAGHLAGHVAYSLATPHGTPWAVIVCADREILSAKIEEARTAGDVSWDA